MADRGWYIEFTRIIRRLQRMRRLPKHVLEDIIDQAGCDKPYDHTKDNVTKIVHA